MDGLPDGEAGYRTGTSFATPFVTAVVAFVRSANPEIKEVSSLDALLKTRDLGRRGKDPIYGKGLLLAPAECVGAEPATGAVTVPLRKPRS